MSYFDHFEHDVQKLKKLGMEQADKPTSNLNTKDYEGGLVLSYDKNESHIPPFYIVAQDVAHLKELCGMKDEVYTEAGRENLHHIPPAVSAIGYTITHKFDAHLCKALSAYVFGNSNLVKSYEDVINKLRFPMRIAVFTGQSITVSPGHPLILKGTDEHPFAAVYDTVTIENGGQIKTEGPGKVSATTINSQTSTEMLANASSPVNFLSLGGDGGSGGSGGNGGIGTTGPTGSASKSGKSSCDTPAGKGGTGGIGGTGSNGNPGGNGGDAGEVNYSTQTLNGNFIAGSIGGNGGDGGNGGNGGQGGPGGPGGASSDHCGGGAQGNGGNGGPGGDGGNGGNGGNGGKVYINYAAGTATITTSPQKANGGNGGNGGQGGEGGDGSSKGHPGQGGKAGTGGTGGTPGNVIVNGPSS